ncbi:DUF4301 family protein [Aureitalea marina]|uniref:NAD metabolism ATPase/kinase n=1 Tax=Aureitalea marina TaxID=930804 RepID=A0A2S7KT42_9FLAO|nr:DUF4301 family protein [Aureitalea marina]PQB05799.1 NAD metabolism ATPase/kinase [Aureitalea marina]
MLHEKDIEQIEDHGLTLEKVYRQLEKFSLGIPKTQVVTPASIGNGIEIIPDDKAEKLIAGFEKEKEKIDVIKFVPASGAATRMFKFLHEFLADYDAESESLNRYLRRKDSADLEIFFDSLNEFPFINEVRRNIRSRFPDYKKSNKGERAVFFVRAMLEEEGLNFSNLPKGLIPFHRYVKYSTTAFEEQLYEAAFYSTSRGEAQLHFTFSPQHLDAFRAHYKTIEKRVSNKTKKRFAITYSFQSGDTDTLAVTRDNFPFRDQDDKLVFRPSGHGALLKNLDEVDADLVFIKNIDNVCAAEYVEELAHWKKILAGKLLKVQKKAFAYLDLIDQGPLTEDQQNEIKSFLYKDLKIKNIPEQMDKVRALLDRPIRVCGVVPNTGAPGGGPFWVQDEDEQISLQIVETSQIDLSDPHQQAVVEEATHFNPVDLVCGLKNYKGEKFKLADYVDPNAGFISDKSVGETPIRALELPGLWNGGMAYWNTLFVQVPVETFNPVKTVNDLLGRMHRPNA